MKLREMFNSPFSGQTKKILFFVTCFVVLIFLFLTLVFRSRLTDTTAWIITNTSNIDAQILWQKIIPCLTTGYTTPHGAIGINDSQIVFHSSCYGIDGNFVALDLLTGHEKWQSGATNGFQVVAINDGFLVVFDDSLVRKVNYSGETIWQSQRFTSRSMRAVFPHDDLIYAPFGTSNGGGIYVVSEQSGEIVETIEDENVIAVFGDFIVRRIDTSIEVIDAISSDTVWTRPMPISSYTPQFFDIDRMNDILLVYLGRQSVGAYNIRTGEQIWWLEQDSGSNPLLFEDKLFLYGLDNILRVYDPQNGQMTGQIGLTRDGISSAEVALPESNVALAAYHDLLSLLYRNTGELITLEISYSEN